MNGIKNVMCKLSRYERVKITLRLLSGQADGFKNGIKNELRMAKGDDGGLIFFMPVRIEPPKRRLNDVRGRKKN